MDKELESLLIIYICSLAKSTSFVQHLLLCNVDNFILFCIRCIDIMGVLP